jgi:DOPA 4,5-dioxygenase
MPIRQANRHDVYHAHVYFAEETLTFATRFFQQASETFGLKMGQVNQRLVGPHTQWSCQLLFFKNDFEALIPWLSENRGELSVLIHADTGDDLKDHTDYAFWLGEAVELDLRGF